MAVKTIPLFKGGTVLKPYFILSSALEINIPLITQGHNYV